MNNVFNNIPQTTTADSSSGSRIGLGNYYGSEIPVKSTELDALTGFFENRGFSVESAQTISYILLYQANIDGYNPMSVLDNMKDLEGTQLTALVNEILNFNRFKSSFLGTSASYTTQSEVSREILP